MSEVTRVFLLMVGCVFTENVVFARLMGVFETLDKTDKLCTATMLGVVTAIVMGVSSICAWLVYALVLVPMNLAFLNLLVSVMIVAAVVWAATLVVPKVIPAASAVLEDSVSRLTVNCAVLGVTLISAETSATLGDAAIRGCFGGVGFLHALVLMAGVRERLEFSHIPESFKGFPISLISAGLMALAFMGFMGIGG